MYPKMTATTERGRMMKKIPQIRLKIALLLVSGGSPNATCGSMGTALAPACESRPQTPQNCSPSVRLLPQPRQNVLSGILLWPEGSSEMQHRSRRQQVERVEWKISRHGVQDNDNTESANPFCGKHYLRQALSA